MAYSTERKASVIAKMLPPHNHSLKRLSSEDHPSGPDCPSGSKWPRARASERHRDMLSVGYELLTRRSELVALRSDDLEERDDGTYRVLIRRSKADQYGAGRIAFTSQKTAQLLRDWLQVRGPEIDWLFCPVYHGKPINRDLSTTTVKRLVKDAAKRAHLEATDIKAFSGHSMRVGAAQDLLKRGFDTAAIMRAGGWKSVNVLARYLEQAEHNVCKRQGDPVG